SRHCVAYEDTRWREKVNRPAPRNVWQTPRARRTLQIRFPDLHCLDDHYPDPTPKSPGYPKSIDAGCSRLALRAPNMAHGHLSDPPYKARVDTRHDAHSRT